jgi:hypothetical protein
MLFAPPILSRSRGGSLNRLLLGDSRAIPSEDAVFFRPDRQTRKPTMGRGSNMGVTRLGCHNQDAVFTGRPVTLPVIQTVFGVPRDCRRQVSRADRTLALTRPIVLPSGWGTASALGMTFLSQLDGWPVHSHVNASPTPSRGPAHDSGSMRLATSSSQWTCTTYSLPASRRTPQESVTFCTFG